MKTETGELVITELKHQDKEQLRAFYQEFTGQVIIGLEASGYSPWFEALIEQRGSKAEQVNSHSDSKDESNMLLPFE